ncbi:hypothetical protein [Robinsoniella peoriensis]|uniref:hypothetical protein n=1 Tax=Robinsoniella peoriensis TaxID=180332 RepID=UPI00362BCF86
MKDEESQKIQAVIYALAEKFLKNEEMDEIKGVINMTRLGQMLVNDGIAQGLTQGMSQGKAEAVLEILNIKGMISDDLKQRIVTEKDVDVLTKWIRIAMVSNTAEEFQKQMQ